MTPNQSASGKGGIPSLLHTGHPWPALPERYSWMKAVGIVVTLLVAHLFLTGCYTYTQAPGATGRIVDAATGKPVRGAEVTRPFVAGGLSGTPGVPSEGLPPATVTTDRNGRFNLSPAMHTQIMFMYLHNPPSISGTFVITAQGYATNHVEGIARSRGLWRADLGEVPLKER